MARRIKKQEAPVSNEPKNLRIDNLVTIRAKTDAQTKVKTLYREGLNLCLHGVAGSGKTFMATAMALEEVLDPSSDYDKLYFVRSAVPTREIGFLKGDEKEKTSVYELPYKAICGELFHNSNAYEILKNQGAVEFVTTSFIRGRTISNAIIIVDEAENLNFHELDSIITRPGENSKIIFCGDYAQSDFTKSRERDGLLSFMKILQHMNNFAFVEFTVDDIVRSALVKEYIITKYKLGFDGL